MTRFAAVFIGCVLCGCAAASPPPCAPSSPLPELTSFYGAEPPARYRIDMHLESGEWRPLRFVMPIRHHGSRLELMNPPDAALASGPDTPLRFTIEITRVDVRPVPDRREWRSVYFAKRIDVCRPPPRAE